MNRKKKVLLFTSLIVFSVGIILIFSSGRIGSLFNNETANSKIDAMGFTKYYSGNYKEAFDKLLPMAKNGDVNAQVTLGNLYGKGLGTKQNLGKAYFWYKKAADQGNSDALGSIGNMYKRGEYFKKDIKQAINYYKKAIDVDNENLATKYNLALIYLNADKGYKNVTEGLKMIKEAAKQGYPMAESQLGISYYLGLYGLDINCDKAIFFTEKSAKQGNPVGQNNLALLYYEGKAMTKNDFEAYKWFYIASKFGNYEKAKQLLNAYSFNLTNIQEQKAVSEAKDWIKTHKEINLDIVGVE